MASDAKKITGLVQEGILAKMVEFVPVRDSISNALASLVLPARIVAMTFILAKSNALAKTRANVSEKAQITNAYAGKDMPARIARMM